MEDEIAEEKKTHESDELQQVLVDIDHKDG